MTAPVWDGSGKDPWLPLRLENRIEAASQEEMIRRSVWAALSDWLTQTSRRVLRGDRPPDLDAIWARAPAWREAVEGIVYRGAIHEALASAYRAIFGADFPWDRRVFVARYLAEVTNRLVRVPDEVFDVVAGQVAQGAALGETLSKIVKRVDTVLSTTETPRWQNRAVVIARTETMGALNGGRLDAFKAYAEDEDESLEKLWLATEDRRTRPTHRAADGQRVPLGGAFTVGGFSIEFPGDPTGPAQEIIQCRCTMLLVEPGEEVALTNRQMKRAAR
jgi:hypothetical protein